MNRRTLIRRIGAAGLASTAVAGTATASTGSVRYGIDREIDVADVSGTVTLDELLEPDEVRGLPANIDPRHREVVVADDAGTIVLDDCCTYCCEYDNVCEDHCSCCTCDSSECL